MKSRNKRRDISVVATQWDRLRRNSSRAEKMLERAKSYHRHYFLDFWLSK